MKRILQPWQQVSNPADHFWQFTLCAFTNLAYRLPHMTVLVLLTATTRTRIIAANTIAAIADRLWFLVALLAVDQGGLLVAIDRHRSRRRLVYHGTNRPYRFLERL